MLVVAHGVKQVHHVAVAVGTLTKGEFAAPGMAGVLYELPVELVAAAVFIFFSHLDFPRWLIVQ